MKKIINKINFGLIGLMMTVPAFAADKDWCELITKMQGIFKLLRTFAFVGAAFYIAGWAWGYIKGGSGVDMDDVKKKGIGLLVGFSLLFLIGIVLTFLLSASQGDLLGCKTEILKGWN